MNLQLVSPYKKCPFACPFCIAAIADQSPYSDSLYYNSKPEYLANLAQTICVNDIETAVITGDTEPTFFPEWLEDILPVLIKYKVNIEIQTRNYKFWGDSRYDVVAYSYDKIPKKIVKSNGKITRAVFINNKNLHEQAPIFYKLTSRQQVTVKQMQKTAYGIASIDDYIDKVYRPISANQLAQMKLRNVRFDENCMLSENRYLIFRCDGETYTTWDEPPKK